MSTSKKFTKTEAIVMVALTIIFLFTFKPAVIGVVIYFLYRLNQINGWFDKLSEEGKRKWNDLED